MLESKPLLFSARAENLRKKVQTLCAMDRHAPGPDHEVITYLEKKCQKAGLEVVREPFTYEDKTYCNLVATKQGIGQRKDEVLYLVAHFDTVHKTPGADDNTSSVAALLEVAHLLKDYAFDRTIKFLLCNLEEVQHLKDQPLDEKPKGVPFVGSSAHVKQLSKEDKENIHGAIVLEMVGYTGQELEKAKVFRSWPIRWALWMYSWLQEADEIGNEMFEALATPDLKHDFVSFMGNGQSTAFLKEAMSILRGATLPYKNVPILVPGNGKLVPNARRSDHVPFWDDEVPMQAIMVSDVADLRNPHYHKESDTPETLDYPYLKANAEKVALILTKMAEFENLRPKAKTFHL